MTAQAAHREVLFFEGLKCGSCALRLEARLKSLPSVSEATVEATTGSVTLLSTDQVRADGVAQAIAAEGLRPSSNPFVAQPERPSRGLTRVVLALVLAAFVMMLMWTARWVDGAQQAAALVLLAMPSAAMVFMLGIPDVIAPGVSSLLRGHAAMDALIVMGAFGALLLSMAQAELPLLDAATSLVALRMLGEYLQRRSRLLTIASLKTAFAHGTAAWRGETKIDTHALQRGDLFDVRPGDASPVDAIVEGGVGQVDESALTGEPTLVTKRAGDRIRAGTPLITGAVSLVAESDFSSGTLGRMARSIVRAASSKPRWQRMADRVASRLIIGLVVAAPLVVAAHMWAGSDLMSALGYGLATVVVTCPCALTLASPLVVMRAVAEAANCGVIVRNADAFERGAEVTSAFFDKTGTLVQQELHVEFDALPAPEDAALVFALAHASRHPVARALHAALSERGVSAPLSQAAEISEVVGYGIEAVAGGRSCRLGRPHWARTGACEVSPQDTASETIFAIDGEERFRFSTALSVAERAHSALERIRAQGVKIALVSGDAPRATGAVAEELNIKSVWGGQTPTDKAHRVAGAQKAGEHVAFIGDGLNDAPAMARADLSVAVPGALEATTDLADVRLTVSAAEGVARFIAIARRTKRVMRQNVALAVIYNVVAVPLAMTGLVSAHAAAIAMVLSSLTVLANTSRQGARSPS